MGLLSEPAEMEVFQLSLLLTLAVGAFVALLLFVYFTSIRKRKVAIDNLEVLIIGAGISGINIGKRLNDIGVKNYKILEEGSGTNTLAVLVIYLQFSTASPGIIKQTGPRSFQKQMRFRSTLRTQPTLRRSLLTYSSAPWLSSVPGMKRMASGRLRLLTVLPLWRMCWSMLPVCFINHSSPSLKGMKLLKV